MRSIGEALCRPLSSDPSPAQLATRFPDQFPHGPVGWIPGWAAILNDLAAEAATLCGPTETVHWLRFKEKYGALRVHYTGPEAVRMLVARVTAQSRSTCQVCGESGRHYSLGSRRLTACRLHLLEALSEHLSNGDVAWLLRPCGEQGEALVERPATEPAIERLISQALDDCARAAWHRWAQGRQPDDATRQLMQQAEDRGMAVVWLGRRHRASAGCEEDEVALIESSVQDESITAEWKRQAGASAPLVLRSLPECDVHAPQHANEPLLAARVAFNTQAKGSYHE